ncbi:predicted protein [Plenodomus lingam JN3]|uniref:Predicted protein n=1 Tax=Leptosphaeria maculans (strain JN3 / isolate v23.1.3 / race Av1-4-5-6-7-8) TaxID=985895 RepID=E5AB02_LEPMJ|nr:predicted protein [Plenodomus lingam JN3]CBY00843.1 predicted protein [Plenodomus lingam JN3]
MAPNFDKPRHKRTSNIQNMLEACESLKSETASARAAAVTSIRKLIRRTSNGMRNLLDKVNRHREARSETEASSQSLDSVDPAPAQITSLAKAFTNTLSFP